jgi:hypothetical protein
MHGTAKKAGWTFINVGDGQELFPDLDYSGKGQWVPNGGLHSTPPQGSRMPFTMVAIIVIAA